jgi:hypothetical protein
MSRTRTLRTAAIWTGAAVIGLIVLDILASIATLAFGVELLKS